MHFDKPVISVILPVFNCEKYLAEAIESILHQTFSHFEILVSDDGSSDSSREIIDHYASLDARIRVFHNLKNEGKVHTANRLLESCRGEFVTVHDADDTSLPDRFKQQVAMLKENPDLIMCGTAFRIIKGDGTLFKVVVMPGDFQEILNGVKGASQFHGPTMVMRKTSLDNSLYRDFFDGYNEDCDLALRLIEKGPCINLSAVLYTYRIRPDSLSKRTITARKKNLYKMAWAFHEQRILRGTDDLMEGHVDKVEELLCDHMKPYRQDLSLIHRENAAFLMYYQLNRPAILSAWRACRKRPFYFNNWRTLQYCVRKTFLGH